MTTLDEMKSALSPEQREEVKAIALKALALEIGHAIVAALAEAAKVAGNHWGTGDYHKTDEEGGVNIDGYYDIETLGRAALRVLEAGEPVTGTGG